MTTATCIHHWLLAPPESTTIPGTCLKCGATREFHPFADEDIRGRVASVRANTAGARSQASHTPEYVSGNRTTSRGKRIRSGHR